jgi:hypothetical protein
VKLRKKKKRKIFKFLFISNSSKFRNTRRNWNEERRVNAETFGLKYRPLQQTGNQRSGYRRNTGRYQRTGNGNYGGRNATYYGNFSSRVRVY